MVSPVIVCRRFFIAGGLAATVTGCFGPRVVKYEMLPVEGLVTMEGQPLTDAEVMLDSMDGPRGFGVTDDSGKFTVTTRQFGSGLPAGTYRVFIGGSEKTRIGGAGGPVEVAHKYREKGVGSVTIAPGGGPLAFDLKRKPEPRGAADVEASSDR